MARSNEWPVIYRPSKFEEVVGQAPARAILSDYVLKGEPRDVFLRGPSGTGKTTLARIYAQAISCWNPLSGGSPCGECDACRKFLDHAYGDFFMVGGGDQRQDDMRVIVERNAHEVPMEMGRRVILFDETRGTAEAYATLLTELEKEDRAPCVYIFTGLDAGKMSEPLLDRLSEIVLLPPRAADVAVRLRQIAVAEGVVFEEEAIELIASAAKGVRKAIVDLQNLHERGPVTTDIVQRDIIVPRFGWLFEYFDALGREDIAGQLEALGRSTQTPNQIASQILALLVAVHVRFVASNSAGMANLSVATDDQCLEILTAIEQAASVGQADRARFWDELLSFWSDRAGGFSEVGLQAHVTRFHNRIHAVIPAEPARLAPEVPRKQMKGLPAPASETARAGARLGRSSVANPAMYLSPSQARSIYEAASFALQVHDAPFNARIQLAWAARGGRSDAALAQAASEFSRHLKARVTTGMRAADFHRIALQERREGRLVTTIVGHVPNSRVDKLEAWLRNPALGERWGAKIIPDVEPRQVVSAKALERHWTLVRELWRGVDHTVVLRDGPALIEVLGIAPKRRRPAGEVGCRRLNMSEGLGVAARRQEAEELVPAFSAFRSRQWPDLFTGWELAERSRRQGARESLRRKVGEIKAQFADGGGGADSILFKNLLQEMMKKQRLMLTRWSPLWGRSRAEKW